MTWVREDDQAPLHRKVAPLSDAAYRFHNEAKCWASRNGTDGRIAADEVTTISLSPTVNRSLLRLIGELVRRRLLHRAEDPRCPHAMGDQPTCALPGPDGWVIHDYLDYNPSAVEVREERKAKAERQRRWRDSRRARSTSRNEGVDDLHDGLRDPPHDVSKDAAPRAPVAPTPPRPAPKEGGGGAPAAPAVRREAAERADGGRAEDRPTRPPPNGKPPPELREQLRQLAAKSRSPARTDALARLREATPDVPIFIEPEPAVVPPEGGWPQPEEDAHA